MSYKRCGSRTDSNAVLKEAGNFLTDYLDAVSVSLKVVSNQRETEDLAVSQIWRKIELTDWWVTVLE